MRTTHEFLRDHLTLVDTTILGHDRFKTQHLTVDLRTGMPRLPSSETSSAQAGPRETAGDAEIADVPAVCEAIFPDWPLITLGAVSAGLRPSCAQSAPELEKLRTKVIPRP